MWPVHNQVRLQMLYLEVIVLVDRASSVRRHITHGGQVHILAGKKEEIHTAALCHTVLRQLLIHSFLRLEQSLWKNRICLGTSASLLQQQSQISNKA